MTNTVNYRVCIKAQADIELFAETIKDAVVSRCEKIERFSAIRLRNTKMAYDSFLGWGRDSRMGQHSEATKSITYRDTGDALELADTVVHELAHAMVGSTHRDSWHNEDWQDACRALGMHPHNGLPTQESYFDNDLLEAIKKALAALHAKYPMLVYPPDIDIPFPAGKEPLPFQLEGVRRMLEITADQKRKLLADEMGLGKTVQTVLYMNVTHPKSILIICPKSLTLSWKRHIDEWCVHEDIKENLEVAGSGFWTFGQHVIMNYEAAVKWELSLKSMEWDLVVFDEMHYLKTPSSKRAKSCFKLDGKDAIGITGSPIVNYFYEIFPLIHWLDRETWPEYGRFESQFGSKSSERFGRNLNRLHDKLTSTIMLRRLKKNVLKELPRKRRQVIEWEPDDATRLLIDEENALFRAFREDKEADAFLINALTSESEVAMSDEEWASVISMLSMTKSYAFSRMAAIAHKIGQCKLELAYDFIENTLQNREAIAVFGHHRDVLTSIAKKFASESVLLLGGNSDQSAATMQAMDKFNNDPSCNLFVGQIDIAQGYSLAKGSCVIFVEEDWVPGKMTQAEDRMHGIGRGDHDAGSLMVYHLTYADSLDTYKAKLTIKKQQSIDRAMNR